MISKLTKEQKAQIPKYIEKWVNLASCPIDRSKSLKLLQEIHADKKPLIFFTESFDNTINLIKFIIQEVGKEKKQKIELEESDQLHSQLDSQLHYQLHYQLRSQLHSQLHYQLDSQLRSQLGSQLRSQLDSQLHSQLRSQLRSQKIPWSYCISYWYYSWGSWYDFGKFIGVKFDEDKLTKFNDIIQNCPVVVFVGNLIFVCENPTILWANGRLHSDTKAAISWKDNTEIYYLHGVKFDKELWQKVVSLKMTFKEIMAIENMEQRMVALKYHPDTLIKSEHSKLIDTWTNPRTKDDIELYEVSGIFNRTQYFASYKDQSTERMYVSAIDPDAKEFNKTALSAMAWKFSLQEKEYKSILTEA